MEPFTFYPGLLVPICINCRFGCVVSEIQTHLRTRHPEISVLRRRDIIQAICDTPGVIYQRAEVTKLQPLNPHDKPIHLLGEPQVDGLGCVRCRYVVREKRRIQEHCRRQHGWSNDWRKGGDVTRRSKAPRDEP